MNPCCESRLFFSNVPSFCNLIGFRATHYTDVDIIGMQPPCCREVIFTMPDIMVSPAFDSKSNLLVIAKKEYAASKAFLSNLNKLRIKLASKIEVDSELFEYCFTYTLYQKLAPFWNKTASFLVQGRSFLQDCDKIPAVGFKVAVTDKICIALDPFLVKMPPVQLEDFVIDFESLWNFKRNPNFIIQCYSIQDCFCYVLPSLKRGRIDSITHSIPSHAPFKTYEDVRQHWKVTNMKDKPLLDTTHRSPVETFEKYGYRLPADECHLFFNITFGSTVFTYPEWCIRNNEPSRFLRCDQDGVCKLFLRDLAARMPSVCGTALKFTKESLFWKKDFPTADGGEKLCLVTQPTSEFEKYVHPFSHSRNNFTSSSTRGKSFEYVNKADTETCNSRKFHPSKKVMDTRYPPSIPMPVARATVPYQTNLSQQHGRFVNNILPSSYRKSDVASTNKKLTNSTENSPKNRDFSPCRLQGGKNIIEIPDSPALEQIVPDDLLDILQLDMESSIHDFGVKKKHVQNNKSVNIIGTDHNGASGNIVISEEDADNDSHAVPQVEHVETLVQCPQVPDSVDNVYRESDCSSNCSRIDFSISINESRQSNFDVKDGVSHSADHFEIPVETGAPMQNMNATNLGRIKNSSSVATKSKQDTVDVQNNYNVVEASNSIDMLSELDNDHDVTLADTNGIVSCKVIPKFKKTKPKVIFDKKLPAFSQKKVVLSFGKRQFLQSQTGSSVVPRECGRKTLPTFTSKKAAKFGIVQTGLKKKMNVANNGKKSMQSEKLSSRHSTKIIRKNPSSQTILSTTCESFSPKKSKPHLANEVTCQPSKLAPAKKTNPFCPTTSPHVPSQALHLAMEILSQASQSDLATAVVDGRMNVLLKSPMGFDHDVIGSSAQLSQQIPDSTVVKKQRSKPKIQEHIDVELLAKNKQDLKKEEAYEFFYKDHAKTTGIQLNKVNAVTLRTWLKGKGVVCRSTEKKDELVKKTEMFLNIFQEQLVQDVKGFLQADRINLTKLES